MPRPRKRTHPHNATLDAVTQVAAAWDDDMWECRLDRHRFERLDATLTNEGTYKRVRRCPRCWTEEHLERSLRSGATVGRGRWLDYTNTKDGYLAPAGTGRMNTTSARDEMWREWLDRETRAITKPTPIRGRRRGRKAS